MLGLILLFIGAHGGGRILRVGGALLTFLGLLSLLLPVHLSIKGISLTPSLLIQLNHERIHWILFSLVGSFFLILLLSRLKRNFSWQSAQKGLSNQDELS